MKKTRQQLMRAFTALLVIAMVFVHGGIGQAAELTVTVSQSVDQNLTSFSVKGAAGSSQVSIVVMHKDTRSIAYMDQGMAVGGELRFSTLLPKGDYTGYVSTPGAPRVMLQDFSIEKEETITGFKALKAVTVAKGARAILPSTAIAVFDSGANREVGVQWPDVPETDTPGEFTVLGVVNGTAQKVQLKLIVSGATSTPTPTPTATPTPTPTATPTPTPTPTATPTPTPTPSPSDSDDDSEPSSGGPTPTPAPVATPSASPSGIAAIKAAAVLDGTTAKAEITPDAISSSFAKATTDSKGVKRVEIVIAEVAGALAYEPVLPASALTNGNASQVMKVTTPVGAVELPGNLLQPQQAGGNPSISLVMGTIGTSGITDPALKAAAGDRPALELVLKAGGKAIDPGQQAALVKITIPYQPKTGEENNSEHLVIQYADGEGNLRKIPNTKYDAGTGMVTFTAAPSGQYALTYVVKSFADSAGYPWAEHAISVLASKGIIEGSSESEFSPAAPITRADFLVLLVRTLGLTANFTGNFSDTGPSDYYYEALGIAKQLGISNGADGNTFHPQDPISRQDLMVLSARALQLAEVIVTPGDAAELASFQDSADVAAYAKDSIAAMVKAEIVAGKGEALAPLDQATRAETAVIMYRIFNKL